MTRTTGSGTAAAAGRADANSPARVLTPAEITTLPWRDVRGLGEVQAKVLLSAQDCIVGLLRLEPGTGESVHVHRDAHHHAWVLRGQARVAGSLVSAGSYVHIPAGTSHAITDVGPDGCELFYVYQPR